MNQSKASRYHGARRRAGCLWLILTVLFFAVMMLTGGSVALRAVTRGQLSAYVLLLALAHAAVTWPITFYRSYHLERQYELSHTPLVTWLRDYVKTTLLSAVMTLLAAGIVYRMMELSPRWWWALAAAAIAALVALLTAVSPVVVFPLFHRCALLERDALRRRLLMLSIRAGVPALKVYEWGLGDRNRRAHAALIGAGATRRILLSDTLLRDFTDDEIEAIVAHEIGHHQHRDVLRTLAAELVLMAGCFYTADLVLRAWWPAAGLLSPRDPAGLPMAALGALAVLVPVTPVLNALSRRNERRADRFSMELTRRPDAFIAAIRRMAAMNLAEEYPSRLAVWLFHTHPPVETRIAAARATALAAGAPEEAPAPTDTSVLSA